MEKVVTDVFLDNIFKNTPNIYAFLLDKGVADNIAEEAQSMVSEYFCDAFKDVLIDRAKLDYIAGTVVLLDNLENCVDQLLDLTEKIRND